MIKNKSNKNTLHGGDHQNLDLIVKRMNWLYTNLMYNRIKL